MSEVVTEDTDGVLTLVLNRPAKKNALTGPMYEVLAEGLERAALDDAIRCVIIRANGDDFCAGNDILDFAKHVPQLQTIGTALEDVPVFRFLKALTYCPKPLIAAVQGQGVGVGVTMLLHCDLVAASPDLRLTLPFLKLGLVPEAGSTLLLPQRIGHARAFAWMALGETIDAEEAMSMGLVNTVGAKEAIADIASDMAARIARLSPVAVAHTKGFMRNPDALWDIVKAEGDVFRRLLTSPETIAAFSAFLSR